VPIVMLSAKSSDIDKVLSLGVGADDYITKPFSPMEVIARIKAHIRRFKTFSGQVKEDVAQRQFGGLLIDSKGYKVTYKDKEIRFTSREFEIIDFLSQYPSQVFSKEQLYDNVWGMSGFGDLNTIAVYIKRIREKFAACNISYIKTVWGVGYKWEEDSDE
jgi:Response regulators consisting of a CheY-like receiver domain and a winged-helix DNA-binding domain